MVRRRNRYAAGKNCLTLGSRLLGNLRLLKHKVFFCYMRIQKDCTSNPNAVKSPRMQPLYIYMKAEYLLSVLENDEIKVNVPADCNDPFEFLPRESEDISAPDTSGIGMICFSEDGSSSTMWAHYADKHKGVCLEFVLPEAQPEDYFEIRDERDENYVTQAVILDIQSGEEREQYNIKDAGGDSSDAPVLLKVKYSPYRSYLTARTIYRNKSGKLRDLPCSRFFAAKGQEWSYEKEWRLFVALGNCLSYHDGCYFVKGLTQYITKVMFGIHCQLPMSVVQRMLKSHQTLSCSYVKMKSDPVLFAVRAEPDSGEALTPQWSVNLEFTNEQWSALTAYFKENNLNTYYQQGGYQRAVFEFLKAQCNLPDEEDTASDNKKQ